jgi:Ca2+/Na+ antiporter
VVAANASGASQPSNAVTLTFPGGCSGVPETLVNLQAWKVGSTIFVSWSPPVSGTAVESYVVSVTGAYVGNIATTGRALSSAAGPRAYAISAAAKNSCGAGPATAAQTVAIP